MNLFDVVYMAICPPAAAVVGYKMYRHGKYRESLPAMLGRRLDEEDPEVWRNGCIWVHAVSVGEVTAAKVMLPHLRQFAPELPLLLTTHTETGQAAAKKLEGTLADAVRYYPVDFSSVVRKFARTYKPKVFIPMETELWPNALDEFHKIGTQIITLNGKVSERSFRRYMQVQKLIRRPLGRVKAFCVQTEEDKRRIGEMAGRNDHIFVTGNCKFDEVIAPVGAEEKARLRDMLGLKPDESVVIAGSTHGGEEEILLDQWKQIEKEFPKTLLVIVPRHPERFGGVWQLIKGAGIGARRISNGKETEGACRVILVDKMGVLTRLYGVGDVAVVAGSFVEGIGGHNLMEAAVHGVPVVYGPYMKSQPDMVRILTEEKGGTRTAGTELASVLRMLLTDHEEARRRGELGREAFADNQGAALRNMEIIRKFVDLSSSLKSEDNR